MRLDLPFDAMLPEGASVLIAGMGGGFDVFCGLPIYFELKQRGFSVHLGSVSFAEIKEYRDGEWLSETLVGVGPADEGAKGYHPERFLSRWFREALGEEVAVWCMDPNGVQSLLTDFRLLTERLGIEAIVLIDGGVDSLTRGDETLVGSVMEDYATLIAVSLLPGVPVRMMACLGMGVETDVSHACVFENIALLTRAGGFLGSSALLAQTEAYQQYEAAVNYVHAQPGQHPSVINASVISSARGFYGDHHATERTRGSTLWISPLMSLYWFFSVDAVAQQNLFLSVLEQTQSVGDVFAATYEAREGMKLRPSFSIPLP